MPRAPRHLRVRAYIQNRSIKDRAAHRARAILILWVIGGLVVLIAIAAAVRHLPA
jgi:hypothetical protein